MKKILFWGGLSVVALLLVFGVNSAQAAAPNWNVSGNYVWNVFGTYFHDISLTQSSLDGTFTGTGSWPSGGTQQTGEIITGTVSGNDINFTVTYTGPYSPGSVWNMTGTIAPDGSISGTSPWNWSFDGAKAKQTQICSSINLVSGTNTKTAGYTETTQANASAALNKNHYSGSGSWFSAFATNTVIGPWVDPTVVSPFAGSGAVWISTATSNQEASSTADQWRLFEDSFKLPDDAIVSSATVSYTADNAASVYLNGKTTAISSTPEPTYGSLLDMNSDAHTYASVFSQTFNPKEGLNKLDFVVRNLGGDWGSSNPTGLLYKVSVNYCVPIHKGDKDGKGDDHGDKSDNANHDGGSDKNNKDH